MSNERTQGRGSRGSQHPGRGLGSRDPAMTPRDLLIHQFGLVQATAASTLERMTAADSLEQLAGNASCATEVLARLVHVQNAAMQLIGVEPVRASDQPSAAGSESILHAGALDYDALATRFLASRERCIAGIAALSDETLTEGVMDPFGQACCRAELLSSLANDQAYHIGQLDMALQARVSGASVREEGSDLPRHSSVRARDAGICKHG